MRKSSAIAFILLAACLSHATTRNAATCSAADIQTQINASAASGDTVVVPSGSCTWSGTTGVSITGKSIKLQAQSTVSQDRQTISDGTIITDSTSSVGLDINSASTTNFVEVTGFTFVANVSKSRGIVEVDGTNSSPSSFNIHHNHFIINAAAPRGINITNVFGLVQHNKFDVGNSGSVQSISVFGCSDGNDGGFTCWNQAESLGTNNAVFEEDNTFIYTFHTESVIDNYGGARYVFRHNVIVNAEACGGHGTDSGNRRSAFSFECYENTYSNTTGQKIRQGTIRGGTGVHFNNTYTSTGGTPWDGVALMDYRGCPNLDQSGWGTADGTQLALGSSNLSAAGSRQTHTTTGAASSTNVLFCSNHRDTICTSNAQCTGGGTCTTFFDGSGTNGYPHRDQPGTTHDQIVDPIYSWNNTVNGVQSASLGTYDGGTGCAIDSFIQSGRDYINNGTTPKAGYTPYTYPHPLQGTVTLQVTTSSLPGGILAVPYSQSLAASGGSTPYTWSKLSGNTPDGITLASDGTISGTPTATGTFNFTARVTDNAAAVDDQALSIVISNAQTFYVNNAVSPGCIDTAGQSGDQTHPWCTVPYATTRMPGSSTVIVKAGTYAGDFTITGPSGAAGAHTIFKVATGESVILDGPGTGSGRIKITGGCSYIDFIGFEITDHNQGLYLDDDVGTSTPCHDVLIDSVHIHHVGQEGIAVRAGSPTGARNIIIQNSEIDHTGLLDPSQNGEGIYVGNSSGTDNTNGVTLLRNNIHDTPSECIELKGDSHDIIVDGNNLSNCITSSAGFGNGGGAIEIDEPRNSSTDPHQIIRNNIIHDLPNGASITKHGIRAGTGATLYNNVLYSIGSSYSCILSNSANFSRLIYHNTVDCTTANALVNSGTTVDSRNNIGPNTTGNLAFNSAYFVNAAGHDYRLVLGASPINIGADLSSVVGTDILGFSRLLNGQPPDLGAYEFTGNQAPVAPPAPGTGFFSF